ncbi:AraC-like ligand-binding domain-containing protein [Sphaerimonospora thailandensis]|uniref:Transcriptional regulator n=1 Tax=Sphaerimonospora thailandensis TaxID=795644 RepID=A0A8J3RD82_9ACTN|nr:helix-turn-helix domain-containing protein [Sphaerimonospora thailandensis]GIH72480.1 transcriptional regulator [Sphaerimonospora thailandensis]
MRTGVAQRLVRVIDTGTCVPRQRFNAWVDMVESICGPLRVGRYNAESFEGSIITGQFGEMRASLIRAMPHAVERTQRLIARADHEYFHLCAILDGEVRVSQDGHAGSATTGSLVAFDSARCYSLVMRDSFRMLAVMLPHQLVGIAPRDTHRVTAAPWCGQRGTSYLVYQLLSGLAEQLTELDPNCADRLEHSVSSLVAALMTERMGVAEGLDGGRTALLNRVQSFARERLGDPSLSPAVLAREHNISLRYLQQLFREHQVSPARWIREERLARCRVDLRDPRLDHLSVASIGGRWGLSGPSHFSRLFRERYAMTPQEFRGCREQRPVNA